MPFHLETFLLTISIPYEPSRITIARHIFWPWTVLCILPAFCWFFRLQFQWQLRQFHKSFPLSVLWSWLPQITHYSQRLVVRISMSGSIPRIPFLTSCGFRTQSSISWFLYFWWAEYRIWIWISLCGCTPSIFNKAWRP